MESILSEWEDFARTLGPAAEGLDMVALRDHAEQILRAAARDLRLSQSPVEQEAKSRGEAIRSPHSPETAAETHGLLRATSGFTLRQLVAEYRALRATVLKLWAEQHDVGPRTLADMTRFNEAIDQAVAESVDFFANETERWRNVFLGVLGHDLRGPLNAILMTSRLLSKFEAGMPVDKLAARLINGGERMKRLLDDLLDYSRGSLDIGIPVTRAAVDLARICEEEVELQRGAWPGNSIELSIEGPTVGEWDGARLKQVLGNLISNAAKYGDRDAPIVVALIGDSDMTVLSVENSGPPIPVGNMEALFEPLMRVGGADKEIERTSMGLGLFIVRHIVSAHGGTVVPSSSDGKTVFRVSLPRSPSPAPQTSGAGTI